MPSRKKKARKQELPEELQTTTLPAGSDRYRRFLLLIPIVAVIAYFNSFAGTYVLDDAWHIAHSPKIRELSLSNLLSDRRPVVTFTLAVNFAISQADKAAAQLSDEDFWGFHLVNLAIHITAGLTLFGVLRRTLARQQRSASVARAAPWLALVTALLWIVHPLQTQSVTYMIQRAESLMGLFYLLTLYCVIRADGSQRAALWYAAAVVACAMGMASKAVMVTAPVVVLAYDRVFLSCSFREALRKRWGLYVGLVATWGILWSTGVAPGVLSPVVRSGSATVGFSYKGVTPLEYALTQPQVILHYLRLSLWPAGQCLDYNWPVAHGAGEILPALLVVAALLAATIWALWTKPAWGFMGLWFFVILGPTSSFIPIKDIAFEHRMYLSLAAVLTLVVLAGYGLFARLLKSFPPGSTPRTAVMSGIVVLATGVLAGATIARNELYHSRIDMYRDVIAKRPNNIRAYNNLATELRNASQGDAAIQVLRKALSLDPDFGSANFNMGALLLEKAGDDKDMLEDARVYLQRAVDDDVSVTRLFTLARTLDKLERTEAALETFRRVLSLEPSYFDARMKVASLLMRLDRRDEAIEQYRKAIAADPTSELARHHLAMALHEANRFPEAAETLKKLLERFPNNEDARTDLGAVLVEMGQVEEGISVYRQVVAKNPNHANAFYNLGSALQKMGRLDEAVSAYRSAVEADPAHADAWSNLGMVWKALGKRDLAIKAYQRATSADPNHVIARFNLGVAAYEEGKLQEAAGYFEEVLKIDPGNQRARQALQEVRRSLQRNP